MDYNNSSIQTTANSIAQGKTTALEVVEACAEWVHSNIDDQLGTSNKASDVLSNRVGDCDGQSHLLIAFLRYLGIPSKISDGWSIDIERKYPYSSGNVIFPGGNGTGPGGTHSFYQVYYPTKYSWIAGDPAQKTLHFYHISNIINCSGKDSKIYDDITTGSADGTYDPATETPPANLDFARKSTDITSDINKLTSNFTYQYNSLFYGPATKGTYLVSARKLISPSNSACYC